MGEELITAWVTELAYGYRAQGLPCRDLSASFFYISLAVANVSGLAGLLIRLKLLFIIPK